MECPRHGFPGIGFPKPVKNFAWAGSMPLNFSESHELKGSDCRASDPDAVDDQSCESLNAHGGPVLPLNAQIAHAIHRVSYRRCCDHLHSRLDIFCTIPLFLGNGFSIHSRLDIFCTIPPFREMAFRFTADWTFLVRFPFFGKWLFDFLTLHGFSIF